MDAIHFCCKHKNEAWIGSNNFHMRDVDMIGQGGLNYIDERGRETGTLGWKHPTQQHTAESTTQYIIYIIYVYSICMCVYIDHSIYTHTQKRAHIHTHTHKCI